MRKPIVAANWKMHKTPAETADFLRDFVVLALRRHDEDEEQDRQRLPQRIMHRDIHQDAGPFQQ